MNFTVVILSKTGKIPDNILDTYSKAKDIIIIVDSDKKTKVTNKNIRYLYRKLDNDFSAQRNFALTQVRTDWVLFVDDDEIISNELFAEISDAIKKTNKSGFFLHRVDTIYYDRQLHGETGSAKIIRLAKTKSGKFKRGVHEYWDIKGEVGILNSPLYHIKDHFISEFIPRMIKYCPIDSSSLTKEGKLFSVFKLFVYPVGKFLNNYFVKIGLLDGLSGLFHAYLMSVQSLTVRIFQWETK